MACFLSRGENRMELEKAYLMALESPNNSKRKDRSQTQGKKIKSQSLRASLRNIFRGGKGDSNIFPALSIVIRLMGVTYLLMLFEIAFFFLWAALGYEFVEVWLLQALAISGYALFFYGTIHSSNSKIMNVLKILASLAAFFVFTVLFLLVTNLFPRLTTIKIVLGFFAGYYAFNVFLYIKGNPSNSTDMKPKPLLLAFILFFSTSGITAAIALQPRTFEIVPKTEPELIFWCGSKSLPDDPEILEKCRDYNIAFMPTVREKDVGKPEFVTKYKKVLSYGINLHFAIGGTSDFMANFNNAKEFPVIYEKISLWFKNESIMDNPCLKSFSIDAEMPGENYDLSSKGNTTGLTSVGYERFPSDSEIEEVTSYYEEFTDAIKKDGKLCGMVQATRFLDNADTDGDFTLLTRNIYSLPIEWDFTVTMLYRTNEFRTDENNDSPPEFNAKALSIFYGASVQGTMFTTSELSFYQNVALEENSHNLAKEHYIFVGNFKRDFAKTDYIKDKEYFMDLDICRHYGNEKVFFYELSGFLYHYGWEGVWELGQHAKQKEPRELTYSTYKSLTFLSFYCLLIIGDLFISLENDLI